MIAIIIALIGLLVVWIMLQRSYQSGESIPSRSISMESAMMALEAQDSQTIEAEKKDTKLASGSFTEVDPIHWARWNVEIHEAGDTVFLKFSSDFVSANGPDLYVHLSQEQSYGWAKGATIENTLALGKLTAREGEQVYAISREEWETYNHSVLIWCRAFGIHFSHALLD